MKYVNLDMLNKKLKGFWSLDGFKKFIYVVCYYRYKPGIFNFH
jgi:hypothetical protein